MPTIWTIWSQLSTASHQKGKDFEKLVKWFLLNDPKWSKKFLNKRVFLWNESPYAWGKDNGVDLIGEDADGYTESWTIDSYKVNNLKELIDQASEAGF